MSIGDNKKLLENVREFAFSRFGSLKGLADAMGIKPQNLNTYLTEKVKIGPKFMQRLREVGFNDNIDNNMLDNVITEKNISLDLSGALELTNTPASRMAQLIGVTPATFAAWQSGTAAPTPDQLATLFNMVVALALSSRHTREPKENPAQATG